MDNKYLTVSVITQYLKHKFDTDEHLRCVFIKGEISNFKSHTSGHLYFSVKDENSKINAVMFSNNAKKLTFRPNDGVKVLIMGRISVYEATGNYQIYVEEMLEDGVGNLYIAYEKLKEQLSKEGLFNPEHKLKIPRIPKRIGVVTAPTGAAIKDIISTIKRRFPICEILLFPSLVQGENASANIVENINRAQEYNLDLLIVGRGGGSIEDLWPFNEECVARAIYDSKVPIISAVGHEIDYTIADFVADLRAPTPTGAAEMAVPNIIDVENNLHQYKIRLSESIIKIVRYQSLKLDALKNSFVIKNPMLMYNNKTQTLDLMIENLNRAILNKIDIVKLKFNEIKNNYVLKNPEILYKNHIENLANILEKLELVNPMMLLKKGYTLTYKDQKVINSIKNINKDDKLNIRLSDGLIDVKVESVGKLNGKEN